METWLAPVDPVVIGELQPDGYPFLNVAREPPTMEALACFLNPNSGLDYNHCHYLPSHLNMHVFWTQITEFITPLFAAHHHPRLITYDTRFYGRV